MTLVPFSKGQMDCLVEAVRGLVPGSKHTQWKALRKAEPGGWRAPRVGRRGREEGRNSWNKSAEGMAMESGPRAAWGVDPRIIWGG